LEIFGIEIAPAGSTARTAYLEDSLRMSEQRTAELLDKAGREMSERLTSCGHAMRNSEERAASYGRRLATSQAANAQLEDHVELLERQNLVLEEYLRLSRERDALDTVDRISKHRQNLIPHIVEGTIGLDGPWDESGYHVASNKTTTQPQTNTRAGYQDSRVSTRPYGGEGEH
jgi:spore cortex formation protein SpoVR/YcgB (stage V sporulation)